ncbi:hypothetical protein FHE72_20380 [Rossellomorea vietnamensis]|uniref:Restriction endonuclease n=1 Tax=Rossellomorea vietnamensis TaxID=218284 RepID=A0A6I6UT04_9BACI|nr:restriction endonuclease [Rossellomorea vietnamensis]QHE63099.1 hypothetical protein FHE72_20380 [Rossellomorea vietnamensis]
MSNIPSFAEIRLEFLKLTRSRKLESVKDYEIALAHVFNLDEELLDIRTPGNNKTFYSRVNFTKKTLKEKGYVCEDKNYLKLTNKGVKHLEENPVPITNYILNNSDEQELNPIKFIDIGESDSEEKILSIINKLTETDFFLFEDILLDFLFHIGYGCAKENLKKNIKKTKDGGLDGYIELDPLGTDRLYIQGKRWRDNPIRDKHIRDFSGALDTVGGTKGLFITTSRFTKEAKECNEKIKNKNITLIDGRKLATLILKYNFQL